MKPDRDLLERQAASAIRQIATQVLDKSASDICSGSAAWSLHRLALLAVDALGQVASQRPELLRPIAQTSIAWPAFVSWHGDFTKGNIELMKALDLGKEHYLKFTFPEGKRGKRWSLKTPANAYAIEMIGELFMRQCACRSAKREGFDGPQQSKKLTRQILALKPLTQDTVPQWFDAGWQMLLESTGRYPESKPRWRALGKHRANHTETAQPGSKTSEANIRDGIKARLWLAFREVVSGEANSD